MRIAYADPPYPGQAATHYRDHPDYAGEVDHAELLERLERDYDGWILHTHVPGLRLLNDLIPPDARLCVWAKTFAAFKANIPVAYAWEPVIVKAARTPIVDGQIVMRDWISAPITLRRGLSGAKPAEVCQWAFRLAGAHRDDTLDDLYPGTGAVQRAWDAWRGQLALDLEAAP
jgi:hypothetical protein